jgi:hypothetical protein
MYIVIDDIVDVYYRIIILVIDYVHYYDFTLDIIYVRLNCLQIMLVV